MELKEYNLFINHQTQELMILVTPFANEVKLKFSKNNNQLIIINELTNQNYCLNNIPENAWPYLLRNQGFLAEIGHGQVLDEHSIIIS